jgi:beta-glucosidase
MHSRNVVLLSRYWQKWRLRLVVSLIPNFNRAIFEGLSLADREQHQPATPMVTFLVTSPRRLAARGGWESRQTARLFARYCERAVGHLGDLVDVACTINELNLAVYLHQTGIFHSDDTVLRSAMRVAAARALGVEPKMFSSFPFCVRARSRDVLLEAHRLGV